MKPPVFWRSCRRALAALAAGTLLIVASSLGWLRWHEDELVFQAAQSRARASGALPAAAERITVRSADGLSLAAMLMRPQAARDRGLWILHLHGNADSAFSPAQLRHCDQLRSAGFAVLCFDYRGFGASPGTASEDHMNEDAEAAYQALIHRGVDPRRIVFWGHSLGSAPAVWLAVRHGDAAALVLFGAFTSIADVAAERYPYLPVRWVVDIHMDSLRRIGTVHIPVMIVHSVHDTIVPYAHAPRLYAAANAPKRLLSLDLPSSDRLGGHADALYDTLASFAPQLQALADSARAASVAPAEAR